MNKLFVFWLCAISFVRFGSTEAQSDSYSIIFIHIGPQVPDYVSDATAQARLFNPDCPIYLLVNECAVEQVQKILSKNAMITIVPLENIPQTPEHKDYRNFSHSFRDYHYWLYTKERFFCLYDFMVHYNLKHVYHLENDNMLYVNLENLLPSFLNHYPSIAATFDNDQRGIAGFIYFADAFCLQKLAQFFVKHASKIKDDMELLGIYRQEFPQEIDHLPIIMEEYSEAMPLKSCIGHEVKDVKIFSNHCTEFQSIFDAAALGQYLGGIDPRHGESKPGFVNESCIFDPSFLYFTMEHDSFGRKVPFATYNQKKCRINNLHIHSKELQYFAS